MFSPKALLLLAPFFASVSGFNVEIHQPLQRPKSSLFVSFTADGFVSPVLPSRVLAPPIAETIMEETQEVPASIIRLTWESDVEQRIREEVRERVNHPQMTMTRDASAEMKQLPYMVAIVGIPGSGKSTSCSVLTGLLRDVGCLLMPFDGYHHSVETLKTFENADDALYRRGAPDTFDVAALKRDLATIKHGHDEEVVSIPGFDHAAGDPEPDAHTFDRSTHKIVVCEGLYLLHDSPEWASLRELFDLTIFVNASVDVCIDRLKQRNRCIPGYTPEEIDMRCDAVDRVNAMTVMGSQYRADLVVESAATLQPC